MSDSARGVFARIRWPRPFAGLRGVTPADVPREVSAGVTLAALMIPLNIGYAQVAGLPPAAGLYAAIVPLVVFALLARRNVTFAVSRADRTFRSWLEKYELMTLIDQKRFYPTNRHAAEAFREDVASL